MGLDLVNGEKELDIVERDNPLACVIAVGQVAVGGGPRAETEPSSQMGGSVERVKELHLGDVVDIELVL